MVNLESAQTRRVRRNKGGGEEVRLLSPAHLRIVASRTSARFPL